MIDLVENVPLDCPFGCGRERGHIATAPCPPQTAKGEWINSPNIAMGTARQLKQDVEILTAMLLEANDRMCRDFLRGRIDTIEKELRRMGQFA